MCSWHLGKKPAVTDVSPSRITAKKEITILKPRVPDDVLSSPGHHVMRTGTACINNVAESPVIRGFIRQGGDHKNYNTICWWRSIISKKDQAFDPVIINK